MTVLAGVAALLYYTGGFGLGIEPGTPGWWWTRPVWICVLLLILLPVAMSLSVFERRPRRPDAPVPAATRQIFGAMLLCLGLAILALIGYGGDAVPWLDNTAFVMVLVGAGIGGLLPRLR
jgi:hypothetical protein